MQNASFQLPDGSTANFDVPDGTTPEQAQAMVAPFLHQMAGTSPQPNAAQAAPQAPTQSEGAAQRDRLIADTKQVGLAGMNPVGTLAGTGEALLNFGTGIGSSIVGGFRGLTEGARSALSGDTLQQSLDAAAQASQDTQRAYTYQPRTGLGKIESELPGIPINAAKAMLSSTYGDIGQLANGQQGRIAGEATGNFAPDLVSTILGGESAFSAAKALRKPTIAPLQDAAIVDAAANSPAPVNYDVPTFIRNLKTVAQDKSAAPVVPVPDLPEVGPAIAQTSALDDYAKNGGSKYGQLIPDETMPLPATTANPELQSPLDKLLAEGSTQDAAPTIPETTQAIPELLSPLEQYIAQEKTATQLPEAGNGLQSPLDRLIASGADDQSPAHFDSLISALQSNPELKSSLASALLGDEPHVGLSPLDELANAEKNKPTVAQVESADPVETLPAKESPLVPLYAGEFDPVAASRHDEAASLPHQVNLTKGQATGDVNQISFEQNARGKNADLANRFNEQNGQLMNNATAIKEGVAPEISATDTTFDHGQGQIDAYKAMDEARQADITQKYQALADANGGKLPVDGEDFVKNANAALDEKMKGSYVPAEIRADMDEISKSGQMNFEKFENMRSNLASEGRKAARAGDGNKVSAVNIVREALEELPMKGEAKNLKPLADTARKAAAERFKSIKADPAYKAVVNDETARGEPSPLADKFMHNYVIKGKTANLQKMIENLKDDPLARQRMGAATLDHLREAADSGRTGNFSQSGYNKALSRLIQENKLNVLLDEKSAQQAKTLGNVSRYTQLQPRGSFVNNSNTLVAAGQKLGRDALQKAVDGIPAVGRAVNAAIDYRNAKIMQRAVGEALEPRAGTRPSKVLGPPSSAPLAPPSDISSLQRLPTPALQHLISSSANLTAPYAGIIADAIASTEANNQQLKRLR